MTDKIKQELKHTHNLLNKAIRTHGINNWREFKNHNNMVNKQIKIIKKEYIRRKFKAVNNKYKFLKQYNNNNKQQVPNSIQYNNKKITSPKQLATISCEYFIDKINNIRNGFTNTDIDPIDILSKLKPQINENMELPYITLKETKKLLNNLKNSNCVGHDDISYKI